ncbi:hypothetical protein GCM10022295_83930 [Streptomyces osmaniensis]|uniref:Uncharacterized protein n=1 Tax=Streptomyces osmaniensis TaxID=593134 RepID=A0ABP6YSW8_9ACTN
MGGKRTRWWGLSARERACEGVPVSASHRHPRLDGGLCSGRVITRWPNRPDEDTVAAQYSNGGLSRGSRVTRAAAALVRRGGGLGGLSACVWQLGLPGTQAGPLMQVSSGPAHA